MPVVSYDICSEWVRLSTNAQVGECRAVPKNDSQEIATKQHNAARWFALVTRKKFLARYFCVPR